MFIEVKLGLSKRNQAAKHVSCTTQRNVFCLWFNSELNPLRYCTCSSTNFNLNSRKNIQSRSDSLQGPFQPSVPGVPSHEAMLTHLLWLLPYSSGSKAPRPSGGLRWVLRGWARGKPRSFSCRLPTANLIWSSAPCRDFTSMV